MFGKVRAGLRLGWHRRIRGAPPAGEGAWLFSVSRTMAYAKVPRRVQCIP